MNRLTSLIYAIATTLFLALVLNACTPYYGGGAVASNAGAGTVGMAGVGGIGGMPFGNTGWQHEGSGFDPAMQPMIAAQQAMNTVYAVSPNGTAVYAPMPAVPTGANATATPAQAGGGYATRAAVQAVIGRVEQNARETREQLARLRQRQ